MHPTQHTTIPRRADASAAAAVKVMAGNLIKLSEAQQQRACDALKLAPLLRNRTTTTLQVKPAPMPGAQPEAA